MPTKPPRPCSAKTHPPCANYAAPGHWLCEDVHLPEYEQARGQRKSRARRAYSNDRKHRAFSEAVRTRDPMCTCHEPELCGDHDEGGRCLRASDDADHWPRTRRQIIEDGDDPDDPAFGRGICKQCHGRATARHSPSGGYRVGRSAGVGGSQS